MMTRRKFLALGALALPTAIGADACIEPTNLRTSKLSLGDNARTRFVHFTDFHYKGDAAYAKRVVQTINELEPEFVCFTGDLVEDKVFAAPALDFIRKIKAPVYGSPGNHDYRCGAPFELYRAAFESTGGGWLVDQAILLEKYDIELVGMAMGGIHAFGPPLGSRRVLLLHYPQMADTVGDRAFNLILAGHSHGGQVRLPLYGALVLPWGVGRYDLGYFESKGGPLYVNPGIGTYQIPWRFNCRPEVTLVTI